MHAGSRRLVVAAGLVTLAGAALAAGWQVQPDPKPPEAGPSHAAPAQTPPDGKNAKPGKDGKDAKPDPYVLGFKMKSLDGKEIDLASYKGKVMLLVNVASKCGYTRQYSGLQKLHDAKKDKGFTVMGFPANNFGAQEPGSDADIAKFCSSTYSITFPMFAKISVKGDDCHPLFQRLAAAGGGEPKWNFTKYLVDRRGMVVARFDSAVTPEDPALLKKIDELLAQDEKQKTPEPSPRN